MALRRRGVSTPPSAATPPEGRRLAVGGLIVGLRTGREPRGPVVDDHLVAPVDLEPRDRFAKHAAVRHRARAMAAREIGEAVLQPEQLLQPLDVPPRKRQFAEPRADRSSSIRPAGRALNRLGDVIVGRHGLKGVFCI